MSTYRHKTIGHLDMDAFFAAVEEREKPWLSGLPVAVGADPEGGTGRGVVATANYHARKYGIHSALPIRTAWRLSEEARRRGMPGVVFLSPTPSLYREVSARIMKILRQLTEDIEQTSIDEAYFNVRFAGSSEHARELARRIKKEIYAKERLTSTIGIGPNKMIAKIASDFKKPDGLTIVEEENAGAFLAPLSVSKIPGIGPKATEALSRMHIKTVADLRNAPKEALISLFGRRGEDMHKKAHGTYHTPFGSVQEKKSIGEQETFREDTLHMDTVFSALKRLCGSVYARFTKNEYTAFKTVVLTVCFHDFETKTRSYTSRVPSAAYKDLELHVIHMIMPFFDRRENQHAKRIRLLGVRVQRFSV